MPAIPRGSSTSAHVRPASSSHVRPASWTKANLNKLEKLTADCQKLLEDTTYIPLHDAARRELNLEAGRLGNAMVDFFPPRFDIEKLPAELLRNYQLLTFKLLHTRIATGDVDWRAFSEAGLCLSVARNLMEYWSATEVMQDLPWQGVDTYAFEKAWTDCQYNFARTLTYEACGSPIDCFPEDNPHAASFSKCRELHDALGTTALSAEFVDAITANAFAAVLMADLRQQDPATNYDDDALPGHIAALAMCYVDPIGQSEATLRRNLTEIQKTARVHIPGGRSPD